MNMCFSIFFKIKINELKYTVTVIYSETAIMIGVIRDACGYSIRYCTGVSGVGVGGYGSLQNIANSSVSVKALIFASRNFLENEYIRDFASFKFRECYRNITES